MGPERDRRIEREKREVSGQERGTFKDIKI